jgi:hypothetical protein
MITALLAVLTVLAGAGARNTQPRTADECWGYNTGGCPYKDVGKHGAVVTASRLVGRADKIRKLERARLSVSRSSRRAAVLLMVGDMA